MRDLRMNINLDVIPKDKPAAVKIPNAECGKEFIRAMKKYYPKHAIGWNIHGSYPYGPNLCFVPHFESQNRAMTYWKELPAKEAGYQILEWNDVCVDVSICTGQSDMPIESLFG